MEFTDSYGNIDMGTIVGVIIFVIVPLFFISRWINLWYWKIDDFKEGQKEQIRLLKKIAGEEVEEEIEEEKEEEDNQQSGSGWHK